MDGDKRLYVIIRIHFGFMFISEFGGTALTGYIFYVDDTTGSL